MKYYVSFSPTDTIFGLLDEEGPHDLDVLVALCVEWKTDATLYDEPGFVRGWIHADGNWRLA